MKNNYYLLRHGMTDYQEKGLDEVYPYDGVKKVPLSEGGKKEVLETAEKVKGTKIDVIYSSDFLRTRQTAEIFRSTLNINDIYFDDRLRDVNLGIYHGKKKEEFYSFFPIDKDMFERKPEGGESYKEAQERAVNVIKDIEKKHKDENILIVSHRDIILFIEGWFKNFQGEDYIKYKKQKNLIKTAEFKKLN